MLLDTSGLYCLYEDAEPLHAKAVAAYDEVQAGLTHSYVLSEFVALAHARGSDRPSALTFMTGMVEDPDVEVIWVAKDLHDAAVELLTKREDKSYSLCDAVSFVLMRERGLSDALTTDRHFEQEGFRRLLK